jgi:hypothetical protein
LRVEQIAHKGKLGALGVEGAGDNDWFGHKMPLCTVGL